MTTAIDAAASPVAQEEAAPAAPAAVAARAALEALVMVARLHQLPADADALAHQLPVSAADTDTTTLLLLAARQLGLKARRVRTEALRLALTPLPALALMSDGCVAVLAQADDTRVLLQRFDGSARRPTIEPLDAFRADWSGELVLVSSRALLAGALARFDFSWFVPSLVRHRKLLAEVLLVSFFLQLFALVSPLFFQVVMDKGDAGHKRS